MKRIAAIIVLLALLYLFLWPVDVSPERWTPPPKPPLAGVYEPNNQLGLTHRQFESECFRCEDVAVDSQGYLYGGTEDGRIVKLKQGEDAEVLANTGGRPLGLHLDKDGRVIVADAQKGLLSVSKEGDLEILSTGHGGRPFVFTDDLDIAADGRIYFSDASWKYHNEIYKHDFIEHRPNGRLLVYDPADGSTEMLLDSLYFANGVALSENDSFVLVNETSMYRVIRYWLKGPHTGLKEVFVDNLPFFPDGISYNEDGIFWIAMMSPRNNLLDGMAGIPFVRKIFVRIPLFLMPKPKNYSFVLGVDRYGNVVYNLQDPEGGFAQITSVEQFGGKLYLGSLKEKGVGVLQLHSLSDN